MDGRDDVPYFGAPPEEHHYAPPPRPSHRRGILRSIAITILVLFLVFILLFTPLLSVVLNNAGPYRAFPSKATFTIERDISISGIGSYTLDMPPPFDIDPAQKVIDKSYSPQPASGTRYGVEWNVWKGSLTPSHRSESIRMTYTISTETLVWKMDSSGDTSQIPQQIRDDFLGDEWVLKANDTSLDTTDRDGDGQPDVMVQPAAPEISSLAHRIADKEPDVYSKAKAIYNYMIDNFRYSTAQEISYDNQKYGGLPKHALATLRDGWGDCDEQSMLYISLLRAVGIPARLELGALYDKSTDTWGGHAWAMVYIPPENGSAGPYWYNVDVVNSEFLVRDCNRMTTYIDDGNGAHLDDYYHIFISASDISFHDSLISVSYTSSGEVRVTSPLTTPGFEIVSFIGAASFIVLMRRRNR